MLKKILNALFTLLFLCLFACDNETPQTDPTPEIPQPTKGVQLTVYLKDNTHITYPLQDNPQITFADGQLIVKTNNRETRHDLQTVLRFTYE